MAFGFGDTHWYFLSVPGDVGRSVAGQSNLQYRARNAELGTLKDQARDEMAVEQRKESWKYTSDTTGNASGLEMLP